MLSVWSKEEVAEKCSCTEYTLKMGPLEVGQGMVKGDCEALAGTTLRKEDGERSGWGAHG